jgi:hypothetical protein
MYWRERNPFAPPTLRRLLYPGLARQRIKKEAFLSHFGLVPTRLPAPFGVGRFLRALGTSINISRDKESGRRELNM